MPFKISFSHAKATVARLVALTGFALRARLPGLPGLLWPGPAAELVHPVEPSLAASSPSPSSAALGAPTPVGTDTAGVEELLGASD